MDMIICPISSARLDEEDGEVIETEAGNGEVDGQENVEAKNGETSETEEGEKKELLKYLRCSGSNNCRSDNRWWDYHPDSQRYDWGGGLGRSILNKYKP